MIGKLAFFFILLIAGIIGLQTTLQNGSFLRFLDTHPNSIVDPVVEYYVGQGYYLFQDLPNASLFLMRVPQRYPDSPLADDAYFAALQALDDSSVTTRDALIDDYGQYLKQFPNGKHATTAQNRIDSYKNGGH